MVFAKAIVASLGGAITAAIAIVAPGSTVWAALTIVSAAITAAGVYIVPNAVSAED